MTSSITRNGHSVDYIITAVRYSDGHERIESVKQHQIEGSGADGGQIVIRSQVINNIDLGRNYHTALESQSGNTWTIGAQVEKFYLEGVAYIRTDGNKTPSDNLGELPEF
jgi:hypothetical protein